ncbi:MAG: BON domain-containing protein [Deltaproteobacteria bacterium]|nr:BON domain-containing protein [Deltaproteobacteria bacterium]
MPAALNDHPKSDLAIQRKVLDELAWDTRVTATEVGVEVRDGVVMLVGTVDSWAKKVAAEEAAHRVSGVLDVANELSVVIADDEPSDTDVATAVRHALHWDVFVPDQRIMTTITAGIVTLRGTVDTYAQRQHAANAIRNLAGVRGVVNEIVVEPSNITAEALRATIRNALDRHADRELDKLEIDVDRGRVTLHGHVQSWREHDLVVGAVTGTRGVKTVIDRLRLA